MPSVHVPVAANGLSSFAVKCSSYSARRLFSLCGPQKLPALTEPVTVWVAGSMWTFASVLPVSDIEVRNSRLAALSAGKVKLPYPVRGVTVSSAAAPLSRPTW